MWPREINPSPACGRKPSVITFLYKSCMLKCRNETLNWASGGPVIITIRTLESGVSGGAIWNTQREGHQSNGSLRNLTDQKKPPILHPRSETASLAEWKGNLSTLKARELHPKENQAKVEKGRGNARGEQEMEHPMGSRIHSCCCYKSLTD